MVPYAGVNAHMFSMHRLNGLDETKDDLNDPFQCAFCVFVADDAEGVEAHVQDSHSPTDPAFFCESCALTFHTDVGLEAHRRMEHACR